jgi:hypothetical protein
MTSSVLSQCIFLKDSGLLKTGMGTGPAEQPQWYFTAMCPEVLQETMRLPNTSPSEESVGSKASLQGIVKIPSAIKSFGNSIMWFATLP